MTGPRRLRIASAMALCALGAVVAVIPFPAQPLAPLEQRELAQARENAKWEQAIAAKRLDAFLRDEPPPIRCQAFVEWSPRLYAVAAGPNAEQHGVRRGDRIKVIGEEGVTTLDDVKRIFSSMPAGVTSVDIVVGRASRMAERESREAPLTVPCRSDRARWEAKKDALEAMTAGRWSDCTLAMQDVIQAWGTGLSGDVEIRGLCAYTTRASRAGPSARTMREISTTGGAPRSSRRATIQAPSTACAATCCRAPMSFARGMRGTSPRISKLS